MYPLNSLINGLMKNPTLIKGSLFSIFSFFNQGISFILLILLASYIDPDAYGKLSMFNTIVVFLGFFLLLSTQGYNSVSYFKNSCIQYKKDFTSIFIIGLLNTILLSIILFLFCGKIGEWTKLENTILCLTIPISLANNIYLILLDVCRIKERITKYGILSCSFASINFIASLFLVISIGLSWKGRVFAQLCTTTIYGLFAVVFFFKNSYFTRSISFTEIKKVAIWGIPLIPHSASVWIKQGGDRMIINQYYDMNEVGLFSFAINLASIIIMIGMAFNSTNSVSIYKVLSSDSKIEDKYKYAVTNRRKTTIIYVVISAFIILFCSFLVPFALPKYGNSIPYFWILAIQALLQCVYFIDSNYLFYYNMTKSLMYITFGTSVFHLLLSLLFTQESMYYTCTIHVISQLIMNSIVHFQVKTIFQK